MTVIKSDAGEWERALVEAALEVTGRLLIREYMRRHQETVAGYVSGRPICRIFKGAEKMEVSIGLLRCWDQEHGPKQVEREMW